MRDWKSVVVTRNWGLFTTIGFFSVVQKPGEAQLTVRARVAADLSQLRTRYLPELSATIPTPRGDYPFRATVSHEALATALGRIVLDLHYDNFKSAVGREQGWDREGIYEEAWSVLRQLQELKPGK